MPKPLKHPLTPNRGRAAGLAPHRSALHLGPNEAPGAGRTSCTKRTMPDARR